MPVSTIPSAGLTVPLTTATVTTLTSTTLSDGTNSTSTTNAIQGSAKAWVSYNGATQAIRASYNVSSVTYNGTGDYTINMTNALVDANYSVAGSGSNAGSVNSQLWNVYDSATPRTSSVFRIIYYGLAGTLANCSQANVAVFR